MPWASKKQMQAAYGGYLGKEMQEKAPQWSKETSDIKSLPMHKKKKKHGWTHAVAAKAVSK